VVRVHISQYRQTDTVLIYRISVEILDLLQLYKITSLHTADMQYFDRSL